VVTLADATGAAVPISNDVPARSDTAAAPVAMARSTRPRRRFVREYDIYSPLSILMHLMQYA
jgi:hypothetical protein